MELTSNRSIELASISRAVASRSTQRSSSAQSAVYDDPILGRDPQPSHMRDYVETTEDNGGVHINSGILNRAFYPWLVDRDGMI